MTTNPTDIASYMWGVELNAANYSGGAAGTFTDSVTGRSDWKIALEAPTFETRNGLEGMIFPGNNQWTVENLNYKWPGEQTIVMICEVDNQAAITSLFGRRENSGGHHRADNNAGRLAINSPSSGSTGFRSYVSGTPIVFAGSFSPEDESFHLTILDSSGLRKQSGAASNSGIYPSGRDFSIGEDRYGTMDGWIAEVHGFHRALHYRDEATLDDLLATLGAKVGL